MGREWEVKKARFLGQCGGWVLQTRGRCAVAAQDSFLNPQNPGDVGQPTTA